MVGGERDSIFIPGFPNSGKINCSQIEKEKILFYDKPEYRLKVVLMFYNPFKNQFECEFVIDEIKA